MASYDIYFKEFDFDKLQGHSESQALNGVARIVHLDLHGKLNRAEFTSVEEVKKAMEERKRDEENILKSLRKISEEMGYLGFVGDFMGYLKDLEADERVWGQWTGKSQELDNIVDHFNEAVEENGAGQCAGNVIVYSNFIYNEYRDMYAEIATKGKSFKSYTGSSAAFKPIEDETDFGKARKAIRHGEYTTAMSLLLPLVKQGNVDAQALMAKTFSRPFVKDEDIGEVFAWCLEAAEQGNAEAMYCLGKIYSIGDERLGVEADEDKCVSWYIKAAAHGHAEAQSHINYENKEVQAMVEEYSKAENTKVSCSGDVCSANQDTNSELIDLEDVVRGFASDSDNKFYVAPNLPDKKIKNFLAKYSYETDEDLILFYFDETLFGSGDSGVVIDSSSININVPHCKDRCVMLHRIDAVAINGLLNKTITLKLSDGEKVSFVLTQSNKGASLLCEAIQRTIDVIA